MRKLSSVNKKRNKTTQALALFALALMVLSVLGFSFVSSPDDPVNPDLLKYNGFDFINQNGLWYLEREDLTFAFKTDPRETTKIDSDLDYINSYAGNPIYIDSKIQETNIELKMNLGQIALRVRDACLDAGTCEGNYPIKTCEDRLIVVNEADSLEIIQEDKCLFINGPEEELLSIVDSVLLKIIGIQ